MALMQQIAQMNLPCPLRSTVFDEPAEASHFMQTVQRNMLPVNLEKADDQTLKITWDDGASSYYPLNFLRRQCPCASCQEARLQTQAPKANPLRILQPHEIVAQELILREAQVVGRYALNFSWSDGHQEGIYTFDFLRELAESEACRAAKARFAATA